MKTALLACTLLLLSHVYANEPLWHSLKVAGVQVEYQAASAAELSQVNDVLRRAVDQLQRRPELLLCPSVVVTVHPDLATFQAATGAAWYQLAVADRAGCRIDMQRLPVVAQHGGLEATLRHELFHLAQPAGWERWRAEGEAQRFAGELPRERPLGGLNSRQLDRLLEAPTDQATYRRSMATALEWVMQGR